MTNFISKSFLTSFWNRVKQIPTSVSYTINNASKTLVGAINDLYSSKQDALSAQTAYSAKGSATKVPVITTNSLGQVTNIEETTISGVDAHTVDGYHASSFVKVKPMACAQWYDYNAYPYRRVVALCKIQKTNPNAAEYDKSISIA